MKSILKIYILFFIIFSSFSFSQAQSEWKVSIEKDAIRVSTREVPGSKFKEYKGEMLVKASLSCLVTMLDDVDNQKNWLYDCKEAKRLKTISKSEGVNYFLQTAPWPVSERDLIVKYILVQNEKTKVVTAELTGVKDYIAEKKDIVRVPSFKGKWELTPVGKGIVKVVYQAHSETGGSIPASIANSACVDIPFYTLKNMKLEMEKAKYKNAVIEEIIEP